MLRRLMDGFNLSLVRQDELASLRNELFMHRITDDTRVMDGFYSNNLGHGTGNDKAEMFSMYREARRSRSELDALYGTSGLIQRIVNLPVNDSARRGVKIHHEEADMLLQQVEDLGIFEKCKQAARYGRVFRLGVVFLDIDDGREPNEPVDINNIKAINSATVYDSDYIRPYSMEYWHDEPEFYHLTTDRYAQIHKDRLMIFNGIDAGMNNYFSCEGMRESIVDMIYRPFRNLDVDYNAASTLAKDFRIPILKMFGFGAKAKGKTRSEVAAAKARYKTMKAMLSIMNGFVMGEQDSMDYLQTNVTGYADLVKLTKDYLCFVSGIPHTKLFNEGTGAGLNNGKGESEQTDWVYVVEDYQNEHFKKPYQKWFRYQAALNGLDPFRFEFKSPVHPNEKEEAEIEKIKADAEFSRARADAIYLKARVFSREECRVQRFVDNKGENAGVFNLEGDAPPEETQVNPSVTLDGNHPGIYVPML